jgi:hypothetical protein
MKPPDGASAQSLKAELAYAPATPWRRRRRAIRRAVLAVLLLAAAGCFWWWHEPLIAHGRLLYWQHKCQTHTFAPDAVVASSSGLAGTTAAPIPAYWTAYEGTVGQGGGSPRSGFAETIVFLHGRRSPAGHERVVAVHCLPLYLTSASVVQAMTPLVVRPAAVWPLTSRPILYPGSFRGGYPVHATVRVFGGQPDPADPSHFTIAYTVNDRPGVIDGRLLDDGTVDLHVREGSADVYPAAEVSGSEYYLRAPRSGKVPARAPRPGSAAPAFRARR